MADFTSDHTGAQIEGILGHFATIPAGAFDLTGATSEPLLVVTAGTNSNNTALQFADGATELKAFFAIPGGKTANYAGGNITIDCDLYLSGTVTATQTFILAAGLIGVAASEAEDATPPTSSNGFASTTTTISASEATGDHLKVTITITAHASFVAGEEWKGYIQRLTGSDTSVASVNVTAITVAEA